MICHAVLAIKQSTLQAIRTLLQEGAVLTSNQSKAIEILKDWRQELKSNGTWFQAVVRDTMTYYVFSQLAEFSELVWLEAEFPNAILELYIGNEWGGPIGVLRSYDELGNVTYRGTAGWVPSGQNAVGFAHLSSALRKQSLDGVPYPPLHLEHLPGGWKGPDPDAWYPYVGTPVW